jgi:hypothetical protein
MDVTSESVGNPPAAHRSGVVASSLIAVGATLGTCFALANPSNDILQQSIGFAAACLAPLSAAILTRHSPLWVRRSAPALATIILGPPIGAEFAQVLLNAAIIFILTGWVLEAMKIESAASPASDKFSRPIIGGSLALAAAPFALLQFIPAVNENLPLFIACLAAIAYAIPAALGWVSARLLIFIERRGIPAIHHCRAEYLRARAANK